MYVTQQPSYGALKCAGNPIPSWEVYGCPLINLKVFKKVLMFGFWGWLSRVYGFPVTPAASQHVSTTKKPPGPLLFWFVIFEYSK